MTSQEKFLSLYKEYEGLVRLEGMEPKAVEDAAEGKDGERLRLCRQFRNYFAHVQDPGFLEPSQAMFRFLQQRVDDMKAKGDTAKKHMKKPEVCILDENTKVSDAAALFTKLKQEELLIVRKDAPWSCRWAVLPVYAILGQKGTTKVGSLKVKTVKPSVCAPLDSYSRLCFDRPVLCTEDGTTNGKLLGQVF